MVSLSYLAVCLLVFVASYSLIIVTTSIGYHRGLAHGAVRIHPLFRRLLLASGCWLTGIDPKAWVVMHRLHHAASDTPDDPHSPMNVGALGILGEQLRSYNRVLLGLERNEEKYTSLGRDLERSWPIRSGMWFLPYLLHIGAAVAIVAASGAWLLAAAYFAGMMSHVIQGGLVNTLGHAVGGRNFDLPDNSRNNHAAAWLILGEGLQNNHHRYPSSARFSYRKPEVDPGYLVCRVLERLGVLRIERRTLMPVPEAGSATSAPAT